jgi:hypothetical protein
MPSASSDGRPDDLRACLVDLHVLYITFSHFSHLTV